MKLLMDKSPKVIRARRKRYSFIAGQLRTPLTRNADSGLIYGVDNGAYSNFDINLFTNLLNRCRSITERCLFVSCPDVVGNARRTLEVFRWWKERLRKDFPLALVAQDGLEDLDIPWSDFDCLFVGGTTEWKESKASKDICKAAKCTAKHLHVGRINTPGRWRMFSELDADTCDGSGLSKYDWMLDEIQAFESQEESYPLFGDF